MKINRARQQESVAVFGHETSLIRDVLDNLELEHALTWLLEAISQHQSGELESEPWHLYQTTLFAMYVDYDNGKVRLSAALACHDADLEMSLKDFVEILGSGSRQGSGPPPLHPRRPQQVHPPLPQPVFQAKAAGTGAGHRVLFLSRGSARCRILSNGRVPRGIRPFCGHLFSGKTKGKDREKPGFYIVAAMETGRYVHGWKALVQAARENRNFIRRKTAWQNRR